MSFSIWSPIVMFNSRIISHKQYEHCCTIYILYCIEHFFSLALVPVGTCTLVKKLLNRQLQANTPDEKSLPALGLSIEVNKNLSSQYYQKVHGTLGIFSELTGPHSFHNKLNAYKGGIGDFVLNPDRQRIVVYLPARKYVSSSRSVSPQRPRLSA